LTCPTTDILAEPSLYEIFDTSTYGMAWHELKGQCWQLYDLSKKLLDLEDEDIEAIIEF
jgi:hypothetical protein